MTKERERFIAAFKSLVAAFPNDPPGPSALNFLLRGKRDDVLPGRLSKLRKRLLNDHGFVYCHRNGRYHTVFKKCDAAHDFPPLCESCGLDLRRCEELILGLEEYEYDGES